MPFKIYQVELKRTSYVTHIVEALDENAAEEVAWSLLQEDVPESELEMWEVNFVKDYEL